MNYFQDDILSESKDNNTILELKELKEEDAGEYVCAGTNLEGSTYSDPVNIDVTCAYTHSITIVQLVNNLLRLYTIYVV